MFYIIQITTPYSVDKYVGSTLGGAYHIVASKSRAINFHHSNKVEAQRIADRVCGVLVRN